MKNQIKIIILIFLLFNSLFSFSQEISGSITYIASLDKEKMKKKVKEDEKTPDNLKDRILETIEDSDSISFKLIFNEKESLFASDYKLMENDGDKKINLTKIQADENSVYYTNLEIKQQFRQSSNFNDILIIVEPYEWEFTNATKKIGDYTCKKATTIMTSEGRRGKISRTVIAWYAIDLPLNFGIRGFNGLPGVTFELNIGGNLTYHLSKIELNPKEEITIKKPKGKKITNKEFNDKLKNSFDRKY
jgi:GLPGLI family protein